MSASSLMSLSWGQSSASSGHFWAKSRAAAEEAVETATKSAYHGADNVGVNGMTGGAASAANSAFMPASAARAGLTSTTNSNSFSSEADRDNTPNNPPKLPEVELQDLSKNRDDDERREERAEGPGRELPTGKDRGGEHAPSTTRQPVAQHLKAHGVPSKEAEQIAGALAPELEKKLEGHQKGSDHHVMFYPEGTDAVVLESRHPQQDHAVKHEGALAISMDTLKDVHEQGLPQTGIDTVRAHLGGELAQLSDLDVVDRYGHDAVADIGREGYPTEFVAEARDLAQQRLAEAGIANPEVSNAQALGVLADAARDSQPSLALTDERSGQSINVDMGDLRQQLGFEQSNQRNSHEAEAEHTQQQAEMAMEMPG